MEIKDCSGSCYAAADNGGRRRRGQSGNGDGRWKRWRSSRAWRECRFEPRSHPAIICLKFKLELSNVSSWIGGIGGSDPAVHPTLESCHFGTEELQITDGYLNRTTAAFEDRRSMFCKLMAMKPGMAGRNRSSETKERKRAKGDDGRQGEERHGRMTARTSSRSKEGIK